MKLENEHQNLSDAEFFSLLKQKQKELLAKEIKEYVALNRAEFRFADAQDEKRTMKNIFDLLLVFQSARDLQDEYTAHIDKATKAKREQVQKANYIRCQNADWLQKQLNAYLKPV